MESISEVLTNKMHELSAYLSQNSELSFEQQEQGICDRENSIPGDLTGYDCPDCLNRGGSYIMRDNGYTRAFKQCHCMTIRKSLKRIQNSGLADMLSEHTFDSFITSNAWQDILKQSAIRYLNDNKGKWFYVGGQVGCGKTHICTALVNEFLKSNRSARYMLWRDEVVRLKACVTDSEEYAKLINPLKIVDVLYVDDLFKTTREPDGKIKLPTQGDINVAFEIFNTRYINKNLVTIISCEYYIEKLLDFDEAVGSRIYQRTKDYCNVIKYDKTRNWRTR